MHDNGKQFTSRTFKHFLVHNHIKDKRIPNSYPQLQGKIEAYNKIVKNEFLALEEDIPRKKETSRLSKREDFEMLIQHRPLNEGDIVNR
jgi:transposase InsO family protein